MGQKEGEGSRGNGGKEESRRRWGDRDRFSQAATVNAWGRLTREQMAGLVVQV